MAKLTMFRSIVATPMRAGYKEYLPSVPLTNYIRCFWEAEESNFPGNNLVIPDLGADIIFTINSKTGNVIDATFVGVSNTAFESIEENSSDLTLKCVAKKTKQLLFQDIKRIWISVLLEKG